MRPIRFRDLFTSTQKNYLCVRTSEEVPKFWEKAIFYVYQRNTTWEVHGTVVTQSLVTKHRYISISIGNFIIPMYLLVVIFTLAKKWRDFTSKLANYVKGPSLSWKSHFDTFPSDFPRKPLTWVLIKLVTLLFSSFSWCFGENSEPSRDPRSPACAPTFCG